MSDNICNKNDTVEHIKFLREKIIELNRITQVIKSQVNSLYELHQQREKGEEQRPFVRRDIEIEHLKSEINKRQEFIDKAFIVHPNLDIDVENIKDI